MEACSVGVYELSCNEVNALLTYVVVSLYLMVAGSELVSQRCVIAIALLTSVQYKIVSSVSFVIGCCGI